MDRSEQLYEESSKVTPGGVSSPVRAFKPYPVFIESGSGCRMRDADGREYIDLCMAYGPLITGHAHPGVMEAAREQLSRGTVYGAPSEPELALLERISKEVPSAEKTLSAVSRCTATGVARDAAQRQLWQNQQAHLRLGRLNNRALHLLQVRLERSGAYPPRGDPLPSARRERLVCKDLIVIALVPGVPLQQQAGIELWPPVGEFAPVGGNREIDGSHHDPVSFRQAV